MTFGQTSQQVQRSSAEDSYVRMDSEVLITPTQLRINYKVIGKSETPILIFDALRSIAQDGALKVDQRLAYVAFQEQSTLIVMRIIPPLPKRKDVEFAYVPWAHRITKNETLLGEILLAIPAEESNPYYPVTETTVFRKAAAKQLQLILQYAPLTGNLQATPVPETDKLFQIQGPGADLHEITSALQLAEKLPVRLRSDRFEPLRAGT